MKPFEYYKAVKVAPANRDDFTAVYVYSRGQVVFQGNFVDYKPHAETRFKGMLVEKTVNEEGLKAQRVAYGAEVTRLEAEFKADLFEEHGVTGHLKANRCFAIAYDYAGGHSGNHKTIAEYFETLVDLIKD